MTGTRLRLQFLLYTDEAPANPRVENSYRDLHLWVQRDRRVGRVGAGTGSLSGASATRRRDVMGTGWRVTIRTNTAVEHHDRSQGHRPIAMIY